MPLSFFTDSIVRLRPGTRESRGSTIFDWSDPNELTIDGCNVQPAATGLSQDGRVLGINEGLTAFVPLGADIQASDRILYDGNIYTINGEPANWRSPSGRLNNMQLNLERWSG